MRLLRSVEFADAGAETGTHLILVIGGCCDATALGDICTSEELRISRRQASRPTRWHSPRSDAEHCPWTEQHQRVTPTTAYISRQVTPSGCTVANTGTPVHSTAFRHFSRNVAPNCVEVVIRAVVIGRH